MVEGLLEVQLAGKRQRGDIWDEVREDRMRPFYEGLAERRHVNMSDLTH